MQIRICKKTIIEAWTILYLAIPIFSSLAAMHIYKLTGFLLMEWTIKLFKSIISVIPLIAFLILFYMPLYAAGDDLINEFDIGCLLYTEIDTELPNYTTRIVYFEKEDYDPTDMHSCIEDKHMINIKLDGKYLVSSRAVWSTHSYVGGRHIGFFRIRDGTETVIYWECTSTISGQQLKQLTNVTCELLAGDKIYMKGYQTSGVTMYLLTGDYWNTRFGVQRIGIGGESMGIELQLPISFYSFCAAGMFMIMAIFFRRSFLINLAVICAMYGIYVEPEFKDTWFQAAAVIVMIWAAIGFFVRIKLGGNEYD